MAEPVSPAEQARRDREWADYQRRTQQRLRQSWKLLDGGKPSDILTDPKLQNPITPEQRRRQPKAKRAYYHHQNTGLGIVLPTA
jgi:hypothetical protein